MTNIQQEIKPSLKHAGAFVTHAQAQAADLMRALEDGPASFQHIRDSNPFQHDALHCVLGTCQETGSDVLPGWGVVPGKMLS